MELRKYIRSLGADKIGFADLSITPEDSRYGFRFGISVAVALEPDIVSELFDGPTLQYNTEYKSVNERLNAISEKTAEYIEKKGFDAIAVTSTVARTLKDNRTEYLPHKTVATLSGMGWIGKSALLITPGFGSAVRLTSVYTDMPLTTDEPVTESKCGDCMICVKACPAGAMTGRNWERNHEREYIYDSHKCRPKTRELCKKAGFDNTICGICINVCPYTQNYIAVGGLECQDRI